MTEADRNALARLLGGKGSARATTDDLQGLLLQVVFALLMIFMIAYFIFVDQQKKERVEEVMALNRQKLTLAIDKVAEDHRIRYGLNALMTQGTDGKRTFDWPVIIRAVNSVDATAATIEEIPYALLHHITNRITSEVPGVNRVLYDLTPKPTGTIEWE